MALVMVVAGCFLLLGASHGPATTSTNSWAHPVLPATELVGTTSSAGPLYVYDDAGRVGRCICGVRVWRVRECEGAAVSGARQQHLGSG